MDLRIGITQTGQIVEIELPEDADRDALKDELESVMAAEQKRVMWVTDKRGRLTGVASDKVSFVELSAADEERRIGFGA